jgi:hypothetical protein
MSPVHITFEFCCFRTQVFMFTESGYMGFVPQAACFFDAGGGGFRLRMTQYNSQNM